MLKGRAGKDIISYGRASIVSSFIKAGLIDEYHLFINPVVLGSGMTIWKEITGSMKLKLLQTIRSSSGIVTLYYEHKKN